MRENIFKYSINCVTDSVPWNRLFIQSHKSLFWKNLEIINISHTIQYKIITVIKTFDYEIGSV